MKEESKYSRGGISAVGLLGVAFVVLKLCGVIDWSWWLVLLPFIIPAAVAILCGVICAIIILCAGGGDDVWL